MLLFFLILRIDCANFIENHQLRGHYSEAMWLVIKTGQDIIALKMLTKFGEDWIKDNQVRAHKEIM